MITRLREIPHDPTPLAPPVRHHPRHSPGPDGDRGRESGGGGDAPPPGRRGGAPPPGPNPLDPLFDEDRGKPADPRRGGGGDLGPGDRGKGEGRRRGAGLLGGFAEGRRVGRRGEAPLRGADPPHPRPGDEGHCSEDEADALPGRPERDQRLRDRSHRLPPAGGKRRPGPHGGDGRVGPRGGEGGAPRPHNRRTGPLPVRHNPPLLRRKRQDGPAHRDLHPPEGRIRPERPHLPGGAPLPGPRRVLSGAGHPPPPQLLRGEGGGGPHPLAGVLHRDDRQGISHGQGRGPTLCQRGDFSRARGASKARPSGKSRPRPLYEDGEDQDLRRCRGPGALRPDGPGAHPRLG